MLNIGLKNESSLIGGDVPKIFRSTGYPIDLLNKVGSQGTGETFFASTVLLEP